MSEKQFYTPDEVAVIFAVDKQTVRRWLRDGTLRGVKIGGGRQWRISQTALDEFAKEKMGS